MKFSITSNKAKALKAIICIELIASLAVLSACGNKSKNDKANTDTESVESSVSNSVQISGDILSTGGNFRKIVVLSTNNTAENDNEQHSQSDQKEQDGQTDPDENAQDKQDGTSNQNPALRPNIGLASICLDDLTVNANISDISNDNNTISASKSEITLDNYRKYTIRYDSGYTINDFDKDIRYFCWSLPDDVTNTFINALGEICEEHGYLRDGFTVTNNTYHTKNYEHYVYEIANTDHIISLAIDYNNTEDIYYMVEDK